MCLRYVSTFKYNHKIIMVFDRNNNFSSLKHDKRQIIDSSFDGNIQNTYNSVENIISRSLTYPQRERVD